MSFDRWVPPVITTGYLGWGNRKNGLEAYGPGGRWYGDGPNDEGGDLLGDALTRVGADEGMPLIVVAVDRFAAKDIDSLRDEIVRVAADWYDTHQPQGPAA